MKPRDQCTVLHTGRGGVPPRPSSRGLVPHVPGPVCHWGAPRIRLLRSNPRRVWGVWWGALASRGQPTHPPTHPPTHVINIFLWGKTKLIKEARNWKRILGTQSFSWHLNPPSKIRRLTHLLILESKINDAQSPRAPQPSFPEKQQQNALIMSLSHYHYPTFVGLLPQKRWSWAAARAVLWMLRSGDLFGHAPPLSPPLH